MIKYKQGDLIKAFEESELKDFNYEDSFYNYDEVKENKNYG